MTNDEQTVNLAYRVGAATAVIGIAADRLERVTDRIETLSEYGMGLRAIELAEILEYLRTQHTTLSDPEYDWRTIETKLDATMEGR